MVTDIAAIFRIVLFFIGGLYGRIKTKKTNTPASKKLEEICFYVENTGIARVIKLSKALNREGVRVKFLWLNAQRHLELLNYSHPLFELHQMNGRLQAIRMLVNEPCIHLSLYNGRYSMAFMLSVAGHRRWILDSYDVLLAYTDSPLQSSSVKLWIEEWCVARAPAVCSRSLEWQLLKKKGVKIKQILFFPEYPETVLSQEKNAQLFKQSGLQKMIYGGGLHESMLKPIVHLLNVNLQAQLTVCAARKSLERLPSYAKAKALEKQGQLTCLGRLPYAEYIKLCRQHNIGVLIEFNAFIIKEPYAMANKVFDYIEQGLIVLINENHFCYRLLKRYVPIIGYKGSKQGNLHYNPVAVNSVKRLLMKNNIKRLITFYEKT